MNRIAFISLLVAVVLGGLVLIGYLSMRPEKIEFTKRVTLRNNDKHPYGAVLAYDWLKDIFPKSKISVLNSSVLNRADLLGLKGKSDDRRKALIIVTKTLYADEAEADTLQSFVEKGNDVFISCRYSSSDLFGRMGLTIDYEYYYTDTSNGEKKFYFTLNEKVFNTKKQYSVKGVPFMSTIGMRDSSFTPYLQYLGWDDTLGANFIRYRYGKGNFYIHTAPVAFSNYFLLTGNNKEYYEKVLSVLSVNAEDVIWDNYFVTGPHYHQPDEKSPFAALFAQPSFTWAIWLIILTCLVFILIELKRRQRIIPILPPIKNDSLDYVETMGRLYFDKHNNYDIALKMSTYFLEHVRINYVMNTTALGEGFVAQLANKSGREQNLIKHIVDTVVALQQPRAIEDKDIEIFYNRLELFYNHHS